MTQTAEPLEGEIVTPTEPEPINATAKLPEPDVPTHVKVAMQTAMQLDAMNLPNSKIRGLMADHDVPVSENELLGFQRDPWYDQELMILRAATPASRQRTANDFAQYFEHIADAAMRAEQFGAASGAIVNAAKLGGHMDKQDTHAKSISITWDMGDDDDLVIDEVKAIV